MSKVAVLDVIGDKGFHIANVESLEDIYNELKCDCFDVVSREINGRRFDVYCDDIGLFKEQPIPSAIGKDMEVMLVGNLLFAHHDQLGDMTDVTKSDISHLKDSIIGVHDLEQNKFWLAVYPVTA